MTKVASKKSKTVIVISFGSEDLADLPTDRDYKEIVTKLTVSAKNPEDIKSLPSIIAGSKLIKLQAQSTVFVEGDTWEFLPTRSKRAQKDITNDKFVKLAAEQLDGFLSMGNPRFVLLPYYCTLNKKNK